MKNKLISIILVCILSLGLIGCGNDLVDKSIENAKVLIENKEYDKALLSLEIALDEEPENGEANKLYRILEKYIESKNLVDNNKFHEAEEIINKLDSSLFSGLSIEEDINNLKDIIDKHNKEEIEVVEEVKNQEENKEEVKAEEANVVSNTQQKSIVEEKKGICFICKKEDYISNLQKLHGFGVVHNYCYESAPVCSICHQTKLIGNEDSDKNGICDYKCDKLFTNCFNCGKEISVDEASRLMGKCGECSACKECGYIPYDSSEIHNGYCDPCINASIEEETSRIWKCASCNYDTGETYQGVLHFYPDGICPNCGKSLF